MKGRFIDKLIARLDKLDPGSLQTQFLHLASEKGLLETIFQAIQEGIIVLDQAGIIKYANRTAEKLLGFSMETAGGFPITRYLKEVDWDSIMNLDEEEWSRLVSREIETTYPEHRFLNFYLVPLSAVDEKENGAVLILRDVTRDREQQMHTRESDQLNAITLLAASVAHEIGNPLNSLNIHLQLLGRDIEDLPEEERASFQELIDIAKNEVGRLDQTINQFLRALRPQPPKVESSDLSLIAEDTLGFMKQEIEDRSVLVELEIPDDLPQVSVDKAQIKQAFFNLIKNAVQAMTEGGLLKITGVKTERFVALSFIDTGSGIEVDDLGHIYEPFHTTKSEGTGLGLMIVQRIMRDHGGEIEVESEPGKGTKITLFFNRDERRIRLLPSRVETEKTLGMEGDDEP